MVCIQCGSETRVTNSRHQKRANQVWRRRHCQNCDFIFTTEETVNYETTWRVKDRSGRYTAFKPLKLVFSLYRSLQHRSTALEDAQALSLTIISRLSSPATGDGIIDRLAILNTAQVALSRFDNLASLHYEANHKG